MRGTSVIGLNKIEKAIIVLALVVLGGIIGWFVPTIAKWTICPVYSELFIGSGT